MRTSLFGIVGGSVASGTISTAILVVLILGSPRESSAEYLIYLRGGHYIVVDNCTFSTGHELRDDSEKDRTAENQGSATYQDCAKGKPEGPIYWSTIDGKFGEVNADDVYAILGASTQPRKKVLPVQRPLEDYLIMNRGENSVNAKIVEEKQDRIYGVKRDELANINRRGVEILTESSPKTRSGEGLCPGEPPEFSVTETALEGGRLVGVVTNLSREQWTPGIIEVEVRERGRLRGKFTLIELNVLSPGEPNSFDESVPPHLLKYVEKKDDPEPGVRLCYRKRKGAKQPSAAQAPK